MKLFIISPSKTRENETRIVTELFEHGLETFHLRKPSMSTKEMRQYIRAIPAHFHNRIVIHSHHRLANEFGLKGIHLTRAHLKKRFTTWFRLRRLKFTNPGLTVSTTFSRIGELYENKKTYDYIFLGTIFDAVSGKFNAGYSRHSVEAAIKKTTVKVIARGGTGIENIESCNEVGFAGMVFYSGVWKKEDPIEAFCEILTRCRELNIPY